MKFIDHEIRTVVESELRLLQHAASQLKFKDGIPKLPKSRPIPSTKWKGIPAHTFSGFQLRFDNWKNKFRIFRLQADLQLIDN